MTLPIWAGTYVGIPFEPHGRDVTKGLDCYGLARAVQAEQFGVRLPSFTDPDERLDDWNRLASVVAAEHPRWGQVPAGSEREGDLILLRVWGKPVHIGTVLAPGEMLHTTEVFGGCIERYRGIRFHKVMGFWRAGAEEPGSDGPAISTATLASTGLVPVTALAGPVSRVREQIELPAGLTLAEIVEAVIPEAWLREYACVALEGHLIPPDKLRHVRPKPGRRVTITLVPQGGGGGGEGGGKNTWAVVLSVVFIIAATIATAWMGGVGGVGAAMGATGAWAPVVGSVVVGLGTLSGLYAINALLPPPRPKLRELGGATRTSPSIAAPRNELRPFGIVPAVFGHHRYMPPLEAVTVTAPDLSMYVPSDDAATRSSEIVPELAAPHSPSVVSAEGS